MYTYLLPIYYHTLPLCYLCIIYIVIHILPMYYLYTAYVLAIVPICPYILFIHYLNTMYTQLKHYLYTSYTLSIRFHICSYTTTYVAPACWTEEPKTKSRGHDGMLTTEKSHARSHRGGGGKKNPQPKVSHECRTDGMLTAEKSHAYSHRGEGGRRRTHNDKIRQAKTRENWSIYSSWLVAGSPSWGKY